MTAAHVVGGDRLDLGDHLVERRDLAAGQLGCGRAGASGSTSSRAPSAIEPLRWPLAASSSRSVDPTVGDDAVELGVEHAERLGDAVGRGAGVDGERAGPS